VSGFSKTTTVLVVLSLMWCSIHKWNGPTNIGDMVSESIFAIRGDLSVCHSPHVLHWNCYAYSTWTSGCIFTAVVFCIENYECKIDVKLQYAYCQRLHVIHNSTSTLFVITTYRMAELCNSTVYLSIC